MPFGCVVRALESVDVVLNAVVVVASSPNMICVGLGAAGDVLLLDEDDAPGEEGVSEQSKITVQCPLGLFLVGRRNARVRFSMGTEHSKACVVGCVNVMDEREMEISAFLRMGAVVEMAWSVYNGGSASIAGVVKDGGVGSGGGDSLGRLGSGRASSRVRLRPLLSPPVL